MKEALAEVGNFKIGGRFINRVRFVEVLCLEHCFIWLRDLDTEIIGAEEFC